MLTHVSHWESLIGLEPTEISFFIPRNHFMQKVSSHKILPSWRYDWVARSTRELEFGSYHLLHLAHTWMELDALCWTLQKLALMHAHTTHTQSHTRAQNSNENQNKRTKQCIGVVSRKIYLNLILQCDYDLVKWKGFLKIWSLPLFIPYELFRMWGNTLLLFWSFTHQSWENLGTTFIVLFFSKNCINSLNQLYDLKKVLWKEKFKI